MSVTQDLSIERNPKSEEAPKDKICENHPVTLETKNDLSILHEEQAQYNEAESLLLEAVEGRCLKLGDTHTRTQESLENLIGLYEALDKSEEANEWRSRLTSRDDAEKED
ncbi:MAG: tetratricopeptide repeat protein [Planctomycetes bacterium]|nr:tetratricopeptide repeat protein [Planctomycetota bacterium]MBL7187472.1 tetratricopeptide repeat protein [Phycisphaerae bacterium]